MSVRNTALYIIPKSLSFYTVFAAECYADATILNHHVVTAVVAVTLYALTLAVQYLLAHLLQVRYAFGTLQIVAAVMAGEQEFDVIILNVLLNLCG